MSNDLSVKKSLLPAAPSMQQTGTNNFNVTNQEGATVNFKLIETSKGLQAVDVCEKELTTI